MAERGFQVFDTAEFDWVVRQDCVTAGEELSGHYKSFLIQFKRLQNYMKAFGIVDLKRDSLFLFCSLFLFLERRKRIRIE
jgi:hypothetical protein